MTTSLPADEAKRWLAFARDDLAVAEESTRSSLIAPHIGCYHAQQAVEKSLKSIFVFLQVRFPFRHDLDELRDHLPPGWQVVNAHADLSMLTQWAVEGQYPGNWPEATDADARAAARQARAVWHTVLDDLDRHGLDVSAFR
ncbi:MAG: HEPN domain-containing protein [Chloroflexi bacterium]|nr:HEPN domain-containing protein [Chloroflexota bacterium]